MSTVKRVLLYVMGVLYVIAGTLHFTSVEVYRPMMPPYLPFHDALIYLSGAAEIVLGIGVMVPAIRVPSAWGVIALLIAIFPANLHIAFNNVPLFGNEEGFGAGNWIRLPFQAIFAAWAYWYTDPAD